MNKKILFTILSMYWSFQLGFSQQQANYELAQKFYDFTLGGKLSHNSLSIYPLQSPNQKIPDRKTKCVIKTHINIKQNVIFGAKLKPV